MKKMFWFLMTVFLVSMVAGCGATKASTPELSPEEEAFVENVSDKLFRKVPTSNIKVEKENGAFSLKVYISSDGDVTNFGNYILDAAAAFTEALPDGACGSFYLAMPIEGKNTSLLTFSDGTVSDDNQICGSLGDSRSGEYQSTRISCNDDLYEKFPAARFYSEN